MGVPDDGPQNSYEEASVINTDPSWMGGGQKVDANLDGMTTYAGHVGTIGKNLGSLGANASHGVVANVHGAFVGGVTFDEMSSYNAVASYNGAQFTQFMQAIATGVTNVGFAAQTVANCYYGTDGWSAANLNSINFAFGDKGAAPNSAGQFMAQHFDTYDNNIKNQSGNPPGIAAGAKPMGPPVVTTDADGTIHTRQNFDNGQWSEVTLSSWSAEDGLYSGTTSTSVTFDPTRPPGHQYVTVKSEHVATPQGVTNTSYDAKGRVTSQSTKTTTVQSDGVVVETTTDTNYSYDPDSGKQSQTTSTSSNAKVVGHGTINPWDLPPPPPEPQQDGPQNLAPGPLNPAIVDGVPPPSSHHPGSTNPGQNPDGTLSV